MKRLALHVLLCLLTFSAGVGIERLFTWETPSEPAVTPEQQVDFDWPVENVLLGRSVSTPTPSPSLGQNLVLDCDSAKFDPSGVYMIIGDNPSRFLEFSSLQISLYETEDGEVAGDISMFTTAADSTIDEHKVSGLVTERRLVLVTAPTTNNIVYLFEGEFLRTKVVSDAPEGTAVLRGTLTKSKNGRKVAQAVVRFEIYVDGC